MKAILRILVILLSLIIVGVSLRPPPKTSAENAPPPPASETPPKTAEAPKQAPQSQQLIKDLLGGAAIEKGKEAKEKISELNLQREKEFEENGL